MRVLMCNSTLWHSSCHLALFALVDTQLIRWGPSVVYLGIPQALDILHAPSMGTLG
jgi:hypothetical protein